VGILRRWRAPRAERERSGAAARIAALEADHRRLAERCRELEARLAALDELPLPPEPLRVRVGHWPEPDHFLGVGRKIAWDVRRLLSRVDRPLESFPAILDFGCGCGRVLRHLAGLVPRQELHGADLDAESVAWCREHLGRFATFEIAGDDPPLRYPDARFDLVLAVSVFSHLPAERQLAWLAELRRVLKPGGLLVASVHGEALLLGPEQAETLAALRREGFLFVPAPPTPGLPDYYRTAYHTRGYLQREWSRYFEVLDFLERGVNNQQDALVCRRPGP
jgi:SAM-dependent methyltransferase